MLRVRIAALLLALLIAPVVDPFPSEAMAQTAETEDADSEAAADAYLPHYMDFSEASAYLRAGAAQSWSEFKAPDVGSRVGFNMAAGVRFHRNIAAELEFEAVPDWKIQGIETTTYAVTFNGRAYFPYRRFHPFVAAGLGTVVSERGKESTGRFAYRFGFGFDVYLTEDIFLTAAYTRYVGNLDDFGYSNMVYGIGYRMY